MKTINPELVHEAMQRAPEDGQRFRQARAAIKSVDELTGATKALEYIYMQCAGFDADSLLGQIRDRAAEALGKPTCRPEYQLGRK